MLNCHLTFIYTFITATENLRSIFFFFLSSIFFFDEMKSIQSNHRKKQKRVQPNLTQHLIMLDNVTLT